MSLSSDLILDEAMNVEKSEVYVFVHERYRTHSLTKYEIKSELPFYRQKIRAPIAPLLSILFKTEATTNKCHS